MYEKKIRHKTPQTVDEAARLILSDLLVQHLQTLSHMTDNDFNFLCERVTPYLIDEFQLWQGNDALLDSCFERNKHETDPARIILNRIKEISSDFNGFIVIT